MLTVPTFATLLLPIVFALLGAAGGGFGVLFWLRDKIVLGGKALSHDAYKVLRWLGRRREWFLDEEVRQGTRLDQDAFRDALSQLYSFNLLEARLDADGKGHAERKLALSARGVKLEEALSQLGDPFLFFYER